MLKSLLLAAALACVPAAGYAQTQQRPPDCSAPEHRAFDFWLGEWDVYPTGADTIAGRSTIASADNGCLVTEHFRSEGQPYSGHSLNIYDRATGRWEQFWVDSTGEVTRFVGGPFEGGMRLTDPANVSWRSATPVQTRMTFTPNADGSVRQHGETSSDGETWTTRYDFTYRRRPD